MALREFWTNVRRAIDWMSPATAVDSRELDASEIEAMIRDAVWLTPKAVEGFEPKEFTFLAEEEQDRLKGCVGAFLEIARQIDQTGPATEAQRRAGLEQLQCVMDIVSPYRYRDLEAFRLGKRIEQELGESMPEWVRGLQFETGNDADGDPALWIWIELEDDAVAEEDVFARRTRQIRSTIADCVHRLELQHWPYIRFRKVSERVGAGERGA